MSKAVSYGTSGDQSVVALVVDAKNHLFATGTSTTIIAFDNSTALPAGAFVAEAQKPGAEMIAPFRRAVSPGDATSAALTRSIAVSTTTILWGGAFENHLDLGGGSTAASASATGYDAFLIPIER